MIEHSSPVLFVVYIELFWAFQICPHLSLSTGILVKPSKMGRYACVQSADDFVKYGFFFANVWIATASSIKAVIFVNHIPNCRAIIVRKRLDVSI